MRNREALACVVGPGAIAAATDADKEVGERGIRCASLSRDAKRRYAADGLPAIRLPRPRTGWWRASLKRDGTGRSSMCGG